MMPFLFEALNLYEQTHQLHVHTHIHTRARIQSETFMSALQARSKVYLFSWKKRGGVLVWEGGGEMYPRSKPLKCVPLSSYVTSPSLSLSRSLSPARSLYLSCILRHTHFKHTHTHTHTHRGILKQAGVYRFSMVCRFPPLPLYAD